MSDERLIELLSDLLGFYPVYNPTTARVDLQSLFDLEGATDDELKELARALKILLKRVIEVITERGVIN